MGLLDLLNLIKSRSVIIITNKKNKRGSLYHETCIIPVNDETYVMKRLIQNFYIFYYYHSSGGRRGVKIMASKCILHQILSIMCNDRSIEN